MNGSLRYLLPEEIVIEDALNVRPFTMQGGESEEEMKAIRELADSMEAAGQVHPVKVRLEDGRPKLISGHRRHKAATLINLGKTNGEEPFRLSAVVEEGVDDLGALRQAMHENMKRRNISPMDFAADIRMLRGKFGWEGRAGTKKVAEFLRVSTATITQYEKLLGLEAEIQAAVHHGVLGAQAAMDLADVTPEKRQEVMEAAVKVKREEEVRAGEREAEEGVKKGKGKGVQQKHVRKAARETEGALKEDKAKALTRKEILDYWEEIRDSPAFGYPDSAVRKFAGYMVDTWAAGKGTDKTLYKYFLEAVKGADQGSAASLPKPEVKTKTTETKTTETKTTKAKKKARKSTARRPIATVEK